MALMHVAQTVSPTVVSLALLNTTWEQHGRDYVDNFVPLVAECIRLSGQDVVSVPELTGELEQKFGLRLPRHAVETILDRAKRRGYVRISNHIYTKVPDELAKLSFRSSQQDALASYEKLVETLQDFCNRTFDKGWTFADAETALLAYLETNQLDLTGTLTRSTPIPHINAPATNVRYLVAAFIDELITTQSSALDYLEKVVKGSMLATAVFLPDPGSSKRKFRDTAVCFDTTFLLYALGYAGEPRQAPCLELIKLLYQAGAELRCFRHTFDEMNDALESCAARLRPNGPKRTFGLGLETVQYFVTQGFTAADVERFIGRLQDELKTLHIRVVQAPPYIHEFVIDEAGFTQALKEAFPTLRDEAVDRDKNSIAAIVRIRAAHLSTTVEDSRAVFVTTNSRLVAVTRRFLSPSNHHQYVLPAVTDNSLTNLLWLKAPMAAPSLPRKRIIADSYAALQPDSDLWAKFLDEIDRLATLGSISPEEVLVLRHSLYVKSALMQMTGGEDEAFTRATVPELLKLAHEHIATEDQKKLEEQMQDRDASLQQVTGELHSFRAAELDRTSQIRQRAQKRAWRVARGLELLWLVIVATGCWALSPWGAFTSDDMPWWKYLVFVAAVAFLVFSVWGIWVGGSIRILVRSIEARLARSRERQLLLLAGYNPDGAQEPSPASAQAPVVAATTQTDGSQ